MLENRSIRTILIPGQNEQIHKQNFKKEQEEQINLHTEPFTNLNFLQAVSPYVVRNQLKFLTCCFTVCCKGNGLKRQIAPGNLVHLEENGAAGLTGTTAQ